MYLRNCNDFNEMILFERVVCQNKQVEILVKLIGLYDEQERFEEELQILNEAAAIEPYNEQFAYQAIQVYGKLGNRTAAINYYKNFEIILRRNLNTAPNNELKLLYKELLESSGSLKLEPKGRDRLPKSRIDITVCGIKEIEYYGLTEIMDQIYGKTENKYFLELNPSYLSDLSFIYRGFQSDYEKLAPGFVIHTGFVPPVRVAFAFLQLIEYVSQRYEIHINLLDMKNLDPVSREALLYMEKRKFENIFIKHESV